MSATVKPGRDDMTKTEFGLLFVCVASPPTTATTRDQSSDNVESAEGSAEDAEGELILALGPSKIVPDFSCRLCRRV